MPRICVEAWAVSRVGLGVGDAVPFSNSRMVYSNSMCFCLLIGSAVLKGVTLQLETRFFCTKLLGICIGRGFGALTGLSHDLRHLP